MTSTSVKGVNLFAGMTPGKTGAATGKSDAFSDCFQQLRDRGQNSGQRAGELSTPKAGTVSTQTDSAVHKSLRDKMTTETRDVKTDGEMSEESAEEKALKAVNKIIAEIAAQLGLTAEQVMQAMEQMNMNPEDLLSADSIKELMIALAGGEGQVNLLTDESLYQSLKAVTQTLDDVMGELEEQTGMDAETLKSLLAEMGQKLSDEAASVEELPVEKETEEKMPIVEVDRDASAKAADDTAALQAQQTQDVKPEHEAHAGKDAKQNKENGQSREGIFQQLGQDNRVNAGNMVQESGTAQGSVDTEQIMRQIMDYMKIQVKADMTEMEIRLHPANLGNINIQIASRNGMITAQFTAQNEAVKAALETQIAQLKDSLNEQGIKVEAVEVTIASHEFERNLEQNQNQPGEGQTDNGSRKGSRRVNLNLAGVEDADLDELFDDMDDAQRIAADMMARSGNTVDFSA